MNNNFNFDNQFPNLWGFEQNINTNNTVNNINNKETINGNIFDGNIINSNIQQQRKNPLSSSFKSLHLSSNNVNIGMNTNNNQINSTLKNNNPFANVNNNFNASKSNEIKANNNIKPNINTNNSIFGNTNELSEIAKKLNSRFISKSQENENAKLHHHHHHSIPTISSSSPNVFVKEDNSMIIDSESSITSPRMSINFSTNDSDSSSDYLKKENSNKEEKMLIGDVAIQMESYNNLDGKVKTGDNITIDHKIVSQILSQGSQKVLLTVLYPKQKYQEIGCIPMNIAKFLIPLLSSKKIHLEGNIHHKQGWVSLKIFCEKVKSVVVNNKNDATCWLAVSKLTKTKLPFSLCSPDGKELGIPQSLQSMSKSCPSQIDLTQGKKRQSLNDESNSLKKCKTVNYENSHSVDVFNFWKNMDTPKLYEMEPDSGFATVLRNYQKQALYWMYERETSALNNDSKSESTNNNTNTNIDITTKSDNGEWEEKETEEGKKYFFHPIFGTSWNKPTSVNQNLMDKTKEEYLNKVQGGILADDMGMGKTVEIISLLASNRPSEKDIKNGEPRGTLIVTPLSVLNQWESEIKKHTQEGLFDVYVFHGSSKNKDLKFLSSKDIVLTTYSTLAFELPKNKKSTNKSKSNTSLENGENSANEDGDSTNEDEEMNLSSSAKESAKCLLNIKWYRVILDEAHQIKDQKRRTTRACFALSSKRRWGITGTPLQNKLEDIFTLLQFLEPNYDLKKWWSQCVMKPIKSIDNQFGFSNLRAFLMKVLLRRTKDQKIDDLPIISLPPREVLIKYVELENEDLEFYKKIDVVAKNTFDNLLQKQTVMKNYAHILELILKLRQACDHPYLVNTAKLQLEENIKNFTQNVNTNFNNTINTITNNENDKELENLQLKFNGNSFINDNLQFDNVLQNDKKFQNDDVLQNDKKFQNDNVLQNDSFQKPLTNMQQFQFINDFSKENNIPVEKLVSLLSEIVTSECEICFEPVESPSLTSCLHIFCNKCLQNELSNSGFSSPQCPSCSTTLSNSQIIQIPKIITSTLISTHQNDIKTKQWKSSAKIDSLIEEIRMMYLESDDLKCIIFSQWTSMLDLVETPLSKNGFKFVRLDGNISQYNRQKAISSFNQNKEIRIFLISTKAGGIGLNLIAASRVFILDPWWNYACESQAIDRVHRLGQTKPVKVIRFIVSGSIEEQILKLQERKQLLAQASFGNFKNKEQLKALRIEELKLIFKN